MITNGLYFVRLCQGMSGVADEYDPEESLRAVKKV